MSVSPQPPTGPPSSGAPVPAGTPAPMGWRERLAQAVKDHWGKVATWVVGGGLTTLVEQQWLRIVPLPDELKVLGLIASALFSLIAVVIIGWITSALIMPLTPWWRRFWLSLFSLGGLLGILFWYILFFFAEGWWKNPTLWFEFFYYFVEPVVYGFILSSFCVFVFSICCLAYDWLFS